jgi:hypothetical protein
MNAKKKAQAICRKLQISDFKYVEIESKKRVLPEESHELHGWLLKHKDVHHEKKRVFFDQFLDTPDLAILRKGASLRLRYKGDGSRVYLQYKGPGFLESGLLFRSEFSSDRLDQVVREESHHDVVHFTDTSVRSILNGHVPPEMATAMRRHLGQKTISRINRGIILSIYHKDKFIVDLGDAILEPSIDRIFAFHINKTGLHSLSTFWEYENEVKTPKGDPSAKLEHVRELAKFDAQVAKRFKLKPERLDKYHRCASCFVGL